MQILKRLAIPILVGAALLACNPKDQGDNTLGACIQLSQGMEEVGQKLEVLHEKNLTLKGIEDAREFHQAALGVLKQSADILGEIDVLYERFEIPCKANYLYREQFDTCMETVYEPFIRFHLMVIKQLHLLKEHLLEEDRGEVVNKTTAELTLLIQELLQALKAQQGVCASDFSPQQCGLLGTLIDDAMVEMKKEPPKEETDDTIAEDTQEKD